MKHGLLYQCTIGWIFWIVKLTIKFFIAAIIGQVFALIVSFLSMLPQKRGRKDKLSLHIGLWDFFRMMGWGEIWLLIRFRWMVFRGKEIPLQLLLRWMVLWNEEIQLQPVPANSGTVTLVTAEEDKEEETPPTP